MLQVWRYAYGGAKVMALKSALLTPEDYRYLLRARTTAEFLSLLTATAYGPALAGWDWQAPGMDQEFSRRVAGELAQAHLKVGRGLKAREARFLQVLGRRLEAENLKVVLRALHQGRSPARAARLLLPLEELSPLPFLKLLKQGTVTGVVESLGRTPWWAPLARGLPRYEREGTLFPLEMSLDLWVFEALKQGLTHLGRRDRGLAGHLLGVLADCTNLLWAGRFRQVYRFPGEETYQYLLEWGAFAEAHRRRHLAFAPSLAELVAGVPWRPYGELLSGAEELAEVESRLARHWLRTLERALGRPPFQIGLPLAYLFLKELEIQNLLTLLTGLSLKVPPEKVRPLLHLRTRGEDYV